MYSLRKLLKLRRRWPACLTVLCLLILWTYAASASEETGMEVTEYSLFSFRFATAEEAADLLLSNRDYYENMNQLDLNYRMQKTDATLRELEDFIPLQMRSFTQAEMDAVWDAMSNIESRCLSQGYRLPDAGTLVFAKTTMEEECGARAYTHGTQIYLGQSVLDMGLSEDESHRAVFSSILAHELFHCLTRAHPEFRAGMYSILHFTVEEEDFVFGESIRERMISNPDVGHHNSWAAFEIEGETRNCAVIFTVSRPFTDKGDSFFQNSVTGLVPLDSPDTMYTPEDADNFWEIFGLNTSYVIDPEETLADNFSFALIWGPEGRLYKTPEIIRDMDALLKEAPYLQD